MTRHNFVDSLPLKPQCHAVLVAYSIITVCRIERPSHELFSSIPRMRVASRTLLRRHYKREIRRLASCGPASKSPIISYTFATNSVFLAGRRCGLMLRTLHVAWSVFLCVCVLGTRVSCAKTNEPIEMPFGGLTRVGPVNHVLVGVRNGRIHSQPGGVTSRQFSISLLHQNKISGSKKRNIVNK